jgi:hypothetical protein
MNASIRRTFALLSLLMFTVPVRGQTLPPHPFVLVDSNTLATLRTQVAQPGWKRDVYLSEAEPDLVGSGPGIHHNAERWVQREITIPERSGHYHWFFCADGTRLTLPANQEFSPGPYRCPQCGRAYSGEHYEAAVRRLVHGWLSVAARDLALVYGIEQRPEYAAKAREILLKYADAYPGPHTGLTEGGMTYQSLDEAMWVIPLAQAFDLIHDQLSPAEERKVNDFLRTVAGGIKSCGTGGNWGSWHLSAVGVVGYATGDTNLVAWARHAFQQQIRDQLGDDGLWPESVHTYHFFPLMAFLHFAEASWNAGDDLYRWEAKPGKSLATMFTAPIDYAYPNLQLPAINDGWFDSRLPADVYELAWRRLQNPLYTWVLNRSYAGKDLSRARGGIYAFLHGAELPSTTTQPTLRSLDFQAIGICMLRSTNGAMLTFDHGRHFGHGQPDTLGVTLFANDRLWIPDYGTPGYGAKILPWFKSTFAHNTIVVDGRNQLFTDENDVHLWLGDAEVEAVASTITNAYPGVAHIRTVVRVGDVFVLRDQLASNKSHDYDFYLRAEGRFSLEGNQRRGRIEKPASPWIEDLRPLPKRAQLSAAWTDGGSGVRLEMLGSSTLVPRTGKCPAETGARKVDLLIVRQSGKTAEFITLLAPFADSEATRLQREVDGVRLVGKLNGKLRFPANGRGPVFDRKEIP